LQKSERAKGRRGRARVPTPMAEGARFCREDCFLSPATVAYCPRDHNHRHFGLLYALHGFVAIGEQVRVFRTALTPFRPPRIRDFVPEFFGNERISPRSRRRPFPRTRRQRFFRLPRRGPRLLRRGPVGCSCRLRAAPPQPRPHSRAYPSVPLQSAGFNAACGRVEGVIPPPKTQRLVARLRRIAVLPSSSFRTVEKMTTTRFRGHDTRRDPPQFPH